MAILIGVELKEGETMKCEECERVMTKGDIAILLLDWFREYAKAVYCGECRSKN
jgi:hypothetical protein